MIKKSKLIQVFCMLVAISLLLAQNTYTAIDVPSKKDKTVLTAPANLSVTAVDETSVTLHWAASYDRNDVAYLIYKDSSDAVESKTTGYTITGLTSSTTYQFYVRAKDSIGNLSKASSSISVTTLASTMETSTPSQDSLTASMETSKPSSTSSTPSQATPMPPTVAPSSKIIAGYYASWSAYSGYTPLNIPASKMTHINYAFAKIGSDLKIALGDASVDIANFTKLNQLKASYPHLKALISVGGWTYSDKFSDAALTDSSRTIFADSVVAFIKLYNFDGVDIDWEYPVSGGLTTNIRRPEDKANFTLLMRKLREKLDAQGAKDGRNYLLSFAGGCGNSYISNVELSTLKNIANYAILMTYDLHGSWDTFTDLNAPLYLPSESSPQYKASVDFSVKAWNKAGFASSKIVLGVPFYGYIYSGVENINNGLYNTFTSGKSIPYDAIQSSYLSNSAFDRFYHPEAKVPYLFNGSEFISYDDNKSILEKATYINTNKLAGASAWELSQNKDGTLINVLHSCIK